MAKVDDEKALLAKVPKDGRGLGNTTLLHALGWSQARYESARDALVARGELVPGPGRGGSVKRPTTDEKLLLDLLPVDGSARGNTTLMGELGWTESRYFSVRSKLLDEGLVEKWTGRGGSIRRVAEGVLSEPAAEPGRARPSDEEVEESYYEPVAHVLRDHWAKEKEFDWCHVEVTARQGRRATGGRWTRPDISVLSLRQFTYLPGKRLDVWTFEIKVVDQADVTAIYEALAHSRAATRSCLVIVGGDGDADADPRIAALREVAEQHGLGLVWATDPGRSEAWDWLIEPRSLNADPERLNAFISQQFSPEATAELSKRLR